MRERCHDGADQHSDQVCEQGRPRIEERADYNRNDGIRNDIDVEDAVCYTDLGQKDRHENTAYQEKGITPVMHELDAERP